MARLSAKSYREDSQSPVVSKRERITGIFKSRRSNEPVPESETSLLINEPLLKPGFEKVGLLPHEQQATTNQVPEQRTSLPTTLLEENNTDLSHPISASLGLGKMDANSKGVNQEELMTRESGERLAPSSSASSTKDRAGSNVASSSIEDGDSPASAHLARKPSTTTEARAKGQNFQSLNCSVQPTTTTIGSIVISNPATLSRIRLFVSILYLTVLLIFCFVGPKALILSAWRMAVVLIVYAQILRAQGYRTEDDLLIEPIYRLVTELPDLAHQIVYQAGVCIGFMWDAVLAGFQAGRNGESIGPN
ncbi:hypothetical protein EJ04DRAFT_551703 [Polyplosphaeria fusca]|uniref:Uncharacterized protein n=1 Tax=Polyplosphaeria fusca TaxID=682080 RepID=A0A9P4QXP8_9PLEO|nr:hypothetical protein EJ04DRAFT_551703 [Polyplosphaeria fusca]